MAIRCKLLDFNVVESSGDEYKIEMFGINEKRESHYINVTDFKPFVYIKVGSGWKKNHCEEFMEHLKSLPTLAYLANNIISYELVEKKSLYVFDAGTYYKFIYISCKNTSFIHKLKSLYYDKDTQKINEGYKYGSTYTKIYECMIPPILRFFHIQKISPSGWITIDTYKKNKLKKSNCVYDINCKFRDVIGIDDDTLVKYVICSFDIEANSSHGDFPESIKNYKKVAYDIAYYFSINIVGKDDILMVLKELLLNVFGFKDTMRIDACYTKNDNYSEEEFIIDYKKIIESKLNNSKKIESRLKEFFKDEENISIKNNVNCSDIVTLLSSDVEMALVSVQLLELFDLYLPKLKGDEVTFIGSTFVNYGEEEPFLNHCICIANTKCVQENQVIECYDSEKDILCAWSKLIKTIDPDIIIGYNIFGFDYNFMFNRAKENDCVNEFMNMGRTNDIPTELDEQNIVVASGPYDLAWIPMTGRLQIDLYTYMRKEFNLPSYKLDYVASSMLSDKVKSYKNINVDDKNTCLIETKNKKGIYVNGYVHFEIISNSTELYKDGEKYKVIEITNTGFVIEGNIECQDKMNWGLAKDDISPKDIFEMSKQGPQEKGIIAKYCIQDCNLVHLLFQKIDILTTYIEMSKLCSVPIKFLVTRGQGIKLNSYMSKKCREMDVLMPLISKGDENEGYEGAIVLEPKCNLYLNKSIACLDYGSLYPSSIISENFCMSSLVYSMEYDVNNNLKKVIGYKNKDGTFKYDNLESEGYKYVDKTFDVFGMDGNNKIVVGYRKTRWAQFPEGKRAVMPSILKELLAARKSTKKQMEKEEDPFKKNILDKRQLSIKVTANSLYGQTGSKTSTFYDMNVAAATTATGRLMIMYAKEVVEQIYGDKDVNTKYGLVHTNAEYIYGDTDSVFFTLNLRKDGKELPEEMERELTISIAKEAGELATEALKEPHDLEYEKIFRPFCLLSKKRYVGRLYEDDHMVYKVKSMGIVLKRRDNAPIVKDVYGGIIDILMKDANIEKAIEFLKEMLSNLTNEKLPIDKLIISKSIKSFYKNPKQIAHNVLSERIGIRDPGNKPAPGDRIPYVYIQTTGKKLQGEKIETPQYIKDHKLKIDYGYYITNQIMNPVLQLFSLVLYDMKEFKRRKNSFIQELEALKSNMEYDKYIKKEQDLKDKEVEKLLFEKYLIIDKNKKSNNTMITSFFK
jgi:DNA polymerase elongation subunit (family B)